MSVRHYADRNLVFIVGCPRSGTTYLQKLLASHPSIHTGWESYVFAWYLGPLLRNWREKESLDVAAGEMRRIGLHSYLQEQEFQELAKKFLEAMMGDMPADHIFLEKTPAHSLWIPEIVELLPDARFINILRDCRDVVSSILAASKTWGKDSLTHHTIGAARLWSKYVLAIENGRKLVPRENFFDIRYEDLLENPVENMMALREFLKVNWKDDDIRTAVEKNDVREALKTGGTSIMTSKEGSRGITAVDYKFEEKSFIRKGKAGSWKTDLRFYQKWQVWLFARKTMAEKNYPWKYPW